MTAPTPGRAPSPQLTDAPAVALRCCCCGASTRGRQWFNRDTGYGICTPCVNAEIGHLAASSPAYGIRGVHFDV